MKGYLPKNTPRGYRDYASLTRHIRTARKQIENLQEKMEMLILLRKQWVSANRKYQKQYRESQKAKDRPKKVNESPVL